MSRPLPPPLEARPPLCSLCGEETWSEDGDTFTCSECSVSWPIESYWLEDGAWDDGPEAEQCRSTVSDAHAVERCWLSAGHAGDHRSPNGSWNDDQADMAAVTADA